MYHYYCTKCYKDLSCNKFRDFDWTEDGEFYFIDKCPDCGGEIDSGFPKEFVNIGFKNNPRWSWSMGVNVEDIPKMQKKYPDRTYNPKTGQLLVKNRPHKKQLMKQHGYIEYD